MADQSHLHFNKGDQNMFKSINHFLSDYVGDDWQEQAETAVLIAFLLLVALMEVVCWLCPLA